MRENPWKFLKSIKSQRVGTGLTWMYMYTDSSSLCGETDQITKLLNTLLFYQ